MNNVQYRSFGEVDLHDPFFESLRRDYPDFDDWFRRKSDEKAYVQYADGKILGFLYLKIEYGIVEDVRPNIIADKILKVGTFKIDAHGTKMGEQFIKGIVTYAVEQNVDVCYVTIYEKHDSLINLVEQFGFQLFGKKGYGEYQENVYLKDMKSVIGNCNMDFPFISVSRNRKYLISIYPRYHSAMFPDSILTTENRNIISDVSFSNSIHKVYVCSMERVSSLRSGDILVLYRTAEESRTAEYSSVVTSICVVEEVRHQSEFRGFEEFYRYACRYSVFDKDDLQKWYNKGVCWTIKMTYNAALKKRIVRHDLIETIGMSRYIYWGFFELTDRQFYQIAQMGEVDNLLRN